MGKNPGKLLLYLTIALLKYTPGMFLGELQTINVNVKSRAFNGLNYYWFAIS